MAAQSGQRIAPLFSAAPGTSEKVSINLDDIFADCFFSQDGGSDVNLLGGEISSGQSLGGPVKMEQQQEKKNTAHVSGPLTTHYPHGPPGLPLASMEEDDYGMGMSGDDSAYSDQIRGGNKRETTNLIGQQEQQQQQQNIIHVQQNREWQDQNTRGASSSFTVIVVPWSSLLDNEEEGEDDDNTIETVVSAVP
mmetsp:Transcript_5430/g.6963  ORF Transcript_5430/g.6963 Transcript_5430/m.6963 type:complete len:193 (-) Transcript_5430:750-1328(-)